MTKTRVKKNLTSYLPNVGITSIIEEDGVNIGALSIQEGKGVNIGFLNAEQKGNGVNTGFFADQ